MTNNLKPDANEQMREKAEALVQRWMKHVRDEAMLKDREVKLFRKRDTNPLRVFAEDSIREAHAAGRQEILDRLPSTIDMIGYAGWLFHESDSNHIERRVGFVAAFNWLKSRLMGESK